MYDQEKHIEFIINIDGFYKYTFNNKDDAKIKLIPSNTKDHGSLDDASNISPNVINDLNINQINLYTVECTANGLVRFFQALISPRTILYQQTKNIPNSKYANEHAVVTHRFNLMTGRETTSQTEWIKKANFSHPEAQSMVDFCKLKDKQIAYVDYLIRLFCFPSYVYSLFPRITHRFDFLEDVFNNNEKPWKAYKTQARKQNKLEKKILRGLLAVFMPFTLTSLYFQKKKTTASMLFMYFYLSYQTHSNVHCPLISKKQIKELKEASKQKKLVQID